MQLVENCMKPVLVYRYPEKKRKQTHSIFSFDACSYLVEKLVNC